MTVETPYNSARVTLEDSLTNSRIAGFYQLNMDAKRALVADTAGIPLDDLAAYDPAQGLSLEQAEHMIENVIGVYALPIGMAMNFTIDGRDRLIPMVVEEPSVVAGLSNAARLVRDSGGFSTQVDEPRMIGQIQILDLPDPQAARERLLAAREELLALANQADAVLVSLGGGARDIEVRVLETAIGAMLALHLILDVRDAMGANAVNTAVEALTPAVERISGGRVGLRIVSNLADRRLARASCRVSAELLATSEFSGEAAVGRIVEAHTFAQADPYRAATHNKGIMNGIDALMLATGNDWRAVEAGAHAYAAHSGAYLPLTSWEIAPEGDLVGSIELPMAAATFGGATRSHPQARLSLRILQVEHASELAGIAAAVGLGQNLAALRALAMEGIQRGHMRLHARQVAMAAGAQGDEIEQLAAAMITARTVRSDAAQVLLAELRGCTP